MTLLTILITMFIVVPTGLVMSLVIQQVITDMAWNDTQQEALAVASAVRGHHLPAVITPVIPGIDMVQVIGPGRQVVAASPAVRGRPPLSRIWPLPGNPLRDLQSCANTEPGCMRLTALRVEPAAHSSVVYAGRRTSGVLSTGFIDTIVSAQSVLLVSLAGWITWKVTGRMLRPVDVIRSALAEITFRDLGNRIPERSDSDEIYRLVRTLNHTLDRLERAVRKQRAFVADASHELRTPLAGLRVQLEEAQLHPQDTRLDALLDRTLADVDRLQMIVTDLLFLAGFESSLVRAREPVDLAALTRGEVDRRADRLPTDLRLQEGIIVDGVRGQLGRVLTNLLDNAQRHAEHRVDVEVRRDGDNALLAVSDDGTGVAEADRARIFERFTRLESSRSRDRGGTGLGLAIAREVVHAHAGTIHVGDSAGGGARFEVRFPLSGGTGR
jgi:signal transduction histidine kinase